MRAENVETVAADSDTHRHDRETAVVFSAHGTPTQCLDEGSRCDVYVEEFCEVLAAVLGIETYHIGIQNHENRSIDWTEPETEELVAGQSESAGSD